MKQKVALRSGAVFAVALLTLAFAACPIDDGSSEVAVTAIHVQSVAIRINGESPDGDTYTMRMDENPQAEAVISPADATIKEVTWTSSDPSVVDIDEQGYINPKKAGGPVTITVKTTGTKEDGSHATASVELTVEEVPGPVQDTTSLVKFNAPDAVYTGAGAVSGFGTGEKYLLYPIKVDLLNDTISIKAKIKIITTSGHNGTGFISVEGSARKGYMLLTAQNVKNVGTTGGLGGQGMEPSVSWAASQEYVFKSEITEGKISHYVYAIDGTTLVSQKSGTVVTEGHAVTDTVYAAIGGTNVPQMEWSEIEVVRNGVECVIDSLLEQTALPSLSVNDSTARVSVNTQGTVSYTASASGGASAEVTAVSDKPDVVRVDSHSGGTIVFTGLQAGSAVITVTNNAEPSLSVKITVTVTNFPATDAYGALTTVYPAAGSVNAYIDGELMLTFDNAPSLENGGSICVYDKTSGDLVDTILFAAEKQVTLGTSSNNINVGSQLVRVEGNSVYITPHFNKLEYGKQYYIAIPQGAITAALNGKTFAGLSSDKAVASWSFTTRAAPNLNAATPLTVDGSQSSSADFRSVYGALKAVASLGGDWTINIAPGAYTELVHYVGSSNITINGTGSAAYGGDVVIQYTNCEELNSGTHVRPSFYFSGANLVLKNITLKNTTARGISYTGGTIPSNTQSETLYFANGSSGGGRTMAAYNCSFLSHQDTIQTTGRNWFYKCYIEGDTDYVWGTADACLLEECELVSVNDPKKTNNKQAILLVARTGSTATDAQTVAKGYVIFNSKVKTESGMTTYFGRNPGSGQYYDQCAVINTAFTNEGNGAVGNTIWLGTAYTYLEGAAEHVGWKVYGNTIDGAAQDTSQKLANTNVIAESVYNSEYNGRRAILNRVYNKAGNYAAAAVIWNIDGLETVFSANADESR